MTTRTLLAAALLLAAAPAHAGGLGRPTNVSARAFGMGGAFTAVADDPTALHFNPAGMALQERDSILVGVETIIAPRRYKPTLNDGTTGETQSPHNTPNVVPALGWVTRLESGGVPSRLALGAGLWNTFGGQLRYDKGDPTVSALDYTQEAVIEVVPGIAYEVNPFLSVGAGFRLGVGLFSVEATAKPADGEFSCFGVGAGATAGLMIRPSKKLNIGLVYRTPLTIKTSGSGSLLLNPAQPPVDVDVKHTQNWPQSASAALAFQLTPRLKLATQLDWTDWSTVNKIIIDFPGRDSLRQQYDVDWDDNYAFHVGGELNVTSRLDLRAGYTHDTSAVPDRTIERQYLDANKHAVALGAGFQISRRWRVDTAFEMIFGPVRDVEDNRMEYADAGWLDRANIAPGEHSGEVYTFELDAQFQY